MFKEKKQRVIGANNSTTGSSNGSAHELMVFNFTNTQVRMLNIDNAPWVVAKDVCDVLEIKNVSVAIKSLDDDERYKYNIGRQGKTWIVNESGLFALVFRSNKPQAKAFRKWVTSVVLPSIRKQGSYNSVELLLQKRKERLLKDKHNLQRSLRDVKKELQAIYRQPQLCPECGKLCKNSRSIQSHILSNHTKGYSGVNNLLAYNAKRREAAL